MGSPPGYPIHSAFERKAHFGKAGIPHFNSDYGLIRHIDHLAWCLSAERMNILMEWDYHAHVWPTVQIRRSLWLPWGAERPGENRKLRASDSGTGRSGTGENTAVVSWTCG